MSSPESVGTMGLVVTALQLLSMLAIGAWKWLQKHKIKKVHGCSYSFVIIGAIILSLALGASAYAAGRIGEIIMPEREIEHSHGHGGGHGHQSEKHSNTSSESNHEDSYKRKNSGEDQTKREVDGQNETSSENKEHEYRHNGHH